MTENTTSSPATDGGKPSTTTPAGGGGATTATPAEGGGASTTTGGLQVEDRVTVTATRGLADEFRAAGFPGELATLPFDTFEERAVTWTGSVVGGPRAELRPEEPEPVRLVLLPPELGERAVLLLTAD